MGTWCICIIHIDMHTGSKESTGNGNKRDPQYSKKKKKTENANNETTKTLHRKSGSVI